MVRYLPNKTIRRVRVHSHNRPPSSQSHNPTNRTTIQLRQRNLLTKSLMDITAPPLGRSLGSDLLTPFCYCVGGISIGCIPYFPTIYILGYTVHFHDNGISVGVSCTDGGD